MMENSHAGSESEWPDSQERGISERQYQGFFGIKSDIRLIGVDLLVTDNRLLRSEMIDALTLGPNAVILDMGCNKGQQMREIRLKRGNNQDLIIGLDKSESALETARSIEKSDFLYSADLAKNVFLRGDMHNIPLPDNSVDGILNSFTAQHSHDIQAAIKEQYRVLKPGGLLVISASSLDQKQEVNEELRQLAEFFTQLRILFNNPEGVKVMPPRRFAENFHAANARGYLSQFFTDSLIKEVTHISEMRYYPEDYRILTATLETYKSEFLPEIPDASADQYFTSYAIKHLNQFNKLWQLGINTVVRPRFKQAIEEQGYLSDNVNRKFFICRKDESRDSDHDRLAA